MAFFKGGSWLSGSVLPALTLFLFLFLLWSHLCLLFPSTCSTFHFHSTISMKYSKTMSTSTAFLFSVLPWLPSHGSTQKPSTSSTETVTPWDNTLDCQIFKPENKVKWNKDVTREEQETAQNHPILTQAWQPALGASCCPAQARLTQPYKTPWKSRQIPLIPLIHKHSHGKRARDPCPSPLLAALLVNIS